MKLLTRYHKLALSVSLAFAIYGSISPVKGDETEAPVVHVDQLDPEADMRPFDKPGFKVRDRSKGHDEIPQPKNRDAAFKAAGLLKHVKGWDAVDRDVLYLRAKSLSLDDLKARYPKLDADALSKLRETVRKP